MLDLAGAFAQIRSKNHARANYETLPAVLPSRSLPDYPSGEAIGDLGLSLAEKKMT